MNNQYKTASRLIYASAVVGGINLLLSFQMFTVLDWMVSLISIAIVAIIGILIAKGYSWVKYVLIVLLLLGFNEFCSYLLIEMKEYPINGILAIIITFLQIIAIILLFLKKSKNLKSVD